ncbi:hypothetical protein ABIB95_007226 [Bradyrhizobium sp. LA2.1]|jgi:hypothetical protein
MHGLTLSTHSESTTYLERGGSEVDLKGFAFEAGEVSKGYTSRPVWLDIAKLADHYREVLARRRTGRRTRSCTSCEASGFSGLKEFPVRGRI